MGVINIQNGEYFITSDPGKLDTEAVVSLLSKTYWAGTRPRETMLKSFENSLCFSLYFKDIQVGFFRVVTDYAVFAYLCDVIIDENYRKNGLGKWAMECIISHPDLKGLKRWCLITKDAQEFYKKVGFKELSNPQGYMEIFNLN